MSCRSGARDKALLKPRNPIVGIISLIGIGMMLAGCPSPPMRGENRTIERGPTDTVRDPGNQSGTVIETLPRAVEPEDRSEALKSANRFEGGRRLVVENGDTLYSLARRHDVAVHSMIEANELEPPYLLKIGQILVVPDYAEVVVQSGDTVYRIARCEGVRMTALLHLNEIKPPYLISPGQRLLLPSQVIEKDCPDPESRDGVPAEPLPDFEVASNAPADQFDPLEIASIEMPSRVVRERDLTPPSRAGDSFLWPVNGEVISDFGPKEGNRRNNGLNIAAAEGAPVRAAENGVVIYAGNELRGYGNLVLVQHDEGWTTAYAHNGAVLVGAGDQVSRGQTIALVGSSGNVSKPQSHFELRRNTEAVNPTSYLTKE